MPGNEEIKVFITTRASACDECKEDLGRKAWITLNRDKGAHPNPQFEIRNPNFPVSA